MPGLWQYKYYCSDTFNDTVAFWTFIQQSRSESSQWHCEYVLYVGHFVCFYGCTSVIGYWLHLKFLTSLALIKPDLTFVWYVSVLTEHIGSLQATAWATVPWLYIFYKLWFINGAWIISHVNLLPSLMTFISHHLCGSWYTVPRSHLGMEYVQFMWMHDLVQVYFYSVHGQFRFSRFDYNFMELVETQVLQFQFAWLIW